MRPLLAGVAMLLLAACAPAPPPEHAAAPASAAPTSAAPPLPPGRTFRVDAAQSEALARVYREGPLARLGHNHVVRAAVLRGEARLAESFADSRFWLEIPLAGLALDEPEQRAAAGEDFAAPLSAEAIAATRANMLGEQGLKAALFPSMTVEGGIAGGARAAPELDAVITLAGTALRQRLPVRLDEDARGLSVSGELELRQSDFGLTPYSALLGALRVQDTVHIRFRLRLVPAV